MAHIKEIRIQAIAWHCGIGGMRPGYFWTWKTFKTFTDDNGNSRYFIDSKEVTKQGGNDEYVWLRKSNAEFQKSEKCVDFLKRERKSAEWAKKRGDSTIYYALTPEMTFRRTVDEYDITYEELIEKYRGSIDQYTDYIDNPRQQREAEEANERIYKKIEELEKLIAERRN